MGFKSDIEIAQEAKPQDIREIAKKLGLTTVDATVSESSEIRQVVESLKGKVDAIYSPTDNMIAAGINTVSMVANEAKIPFIVAEEGMCTGGGLATYGVNYYKLGQQTAKQAVKILEGKAEPKDMPIEYKGNILFSSHDHEFIQTVANRIIELTPNGIIDKMMEYDEYITSDHIKELRARMYGNNK